MDGAGSVGQTHDICCPHNLSPSGSMPIGISLAAFQDWEKIPGKTFWDRCGNMSELDDRNWRLLNSQQYIEVVGRQPTIREVYYQYYLPKYREGQCWMHSKPELCGCHLLSVSNKSTLKLITLGKNKYFNFNIFMTVQITSINKKFHNPDASANNQTQ